MRSSPPRWTPGCRCATYRKPPRTLTAQHDPVRPGPHLAGPACDLHRRPVRCRSRPVTAPGRQASTRPGQADRRRHRRP
jgi:hypothetical protein